MRLAIALLRTALVVVFGFCLFTAAQARAATAEHVVVPSAAMGRDIPVAIS